jgi:hypothetical protein
VQKEGNYPIMELVFGIFLLSFYLFVAFVVRTIQYIKEGGEKRGDKGTGAKDGSCDG